MRIERKIEDLKSIGEEIAIYAQKTASNSDKIVSMLSSILQYQKQNSKVERKKDIGNKAKKINLKRESTQLARQHPMDLRSYSAKRIKRITNTDFNKSISNEEHLEYLFTYEQNDGLFKARLLNAAKFILCDSNVVHINASTNGKQKELRTVWQAIEYITNKLLCTTPVVLFNASEKSDQPIIENDQINNFLITAILSNILSRNTINYIDNEKQIAKFDTQNFNNRISLIIKIIDEFARSTDSIASMLENALAAINSKTESEAKLEKIKQYVRFSNVLHNNPTVAYIPIKIPYCEYETLKTIKDVFIYKFLPFLKQYFALPENEHLIDVVKIDLGLNTLDFLNSSSDCLNNKIEI